MFNLNQKRIIKSLPTYTLRAFQSTDLRVALIAVLAFYTIQVFAQVPAGSAQFNSQFNQAIHLSLKGKSKASEKKLNSLTNSVQGDLRDQVLMALARTQFQSGKLDEAAKTLEHVRKGSDFWFEALEERAWVALRNRDPERALAILETNLKDVFLPLVGPESYFLAAYSHLRTCNYEQALKTMNLFRSKFRDRIVSLQEIVKSDTPNEVMTRSLDKLLSDGWNMGSLKRDAHLLPRLMLHDHKLIEIYNKLSKSSNRNLRERFFSRLQVLANTDLSEMTRIVSQFQIMDVEITQRVFSKQKLNSSLEGRNEAPKLESSNRIRFKQDNEVWLDEIDKYHVRAKGCVPQGRGKQETVL